MLELTELIAHPELLDRETLYELRSMLARYPYFQTVRLLMLQNLYVLHDPAFDEELRRAAIYITDRKTIFQMIEAAHYQLNATRKTEEKQSANRTVDLIDTFLDTIPPEAKEPKPKRKPTPADAAVDYVAYLLETEGDSVAPAASDDDDNTATTSRTVDLIDNFLGQEQGRILLSELPPAADEEDEENAESGEEDEEFFTETLARIYIKQGRYQKAHDIISRLSTAKYPQKNAYFNDQLRFLEKLIINSNNKKNLN